MAECNLVARIDTTAAYKALADLLACARQAVSQAEAEAATWQVRETFAALRVEIEAVDQAGGTCTGLTARWCPKCGECLCPQDGGMDTPSCPLHSALSPHAEGEADQ